MCEKVKEMSKKMCAIVTLVLALLMSSISYASDYETHWAKNEIELFHTDKVLSLSGDNFFPDAPATVIEISTVLNSLDFYNKEENIEILKEKVLPFTNENANRCITREEMAIIVTKLLCLDVNFEDKTTFQDDEDILSWSKCYVAKLQKEKILIGYPDNSFQPKREVTKAELVTIASRCKNYIEHEVLLLDDRDVSKIEIGFLEYGDEGSSISKIDETIRMNLGEELVLAISLPDDLIGKTVNFEIEDSSIAQINEETLELTALSIGKTKVRFYVAETNYETIINIQVKETEK